MKIDQKSDFEKWLGAFSAYFELKVRSFSATLKEIIQIKSESEQKRNRNAEKAKSL
jgi:hypothetical protein